MGLPKMLNNVEMCFFLGGGGGGQEKQITSEMEMQYKYQFGLLIVMLQYNYCNVIQNYYLK
jgi:hypothetical protein